MVGTPSWMSLMGGRLFRMCRGPPGCPGVVGWSSRMSESGRETLANVREW